MSCPRGKSWKSKYKMGTIPHGTSHTLMFGEIAKDPFESRLDDARLGANQFGIDLLDAVRFCLA